MKTFSSLFNWTLDARVNLNKGALSSWPGKCLLKGSGSPVSYGWTLPIGRTCSVVFLSVHKKQVYALWSCSVTLSPFGCPSSRQRQIGIVSGQAARSSQRREVRSSDRISDPDNISPLSALALPSSYPFCLPSLLLWRHPSLLAA